MDSNGDATRGIPWATLLRPRWMLCGFAGALLLLRALVELIPVHINIGPDTTVLSGPVRPDGSIDYAAVIDEEWAKGVTPDSNAVVDLVRAFGPTTISAEIRSEYLARLGLSSLVATPDQFVDFYTFLSERGVSDVRDDRERAVQDFETAQSRPWTAEQFPLIAEWLARNEAAIQWVLTASRKPLYYSPIVLEKGSPTLVGWNLPDLDLCYRAGEFLCVSAMYELGSSDIEAAFESSLACHRLARLLSQHPTLMATSGARDITTDAMVCDSAISTHPEITEHQVQRFRELVAALPPFRDPIEKTDRTERFTMLDLVQAACLDKMSDDFAAHYDHYSGKFNPNPALRAVNQAYSEIVVALRLPSRAEKLAALRRHEARVDAMPDISPQMLMFGRLVGSPMMAGHDYAKRVVTEFITGIGDYESLIETEVAQLLVLDAGYAVAEYRARHGVYPASLEELVPDPLAALPLDPFTGTPLTYTTTDDGFLLYSVGANELDEGGVWMNWRDDIAFGDVPKVEEVVE